MMGLEVGASALMSAMMRLLIAKPMRKNALSAMEESPTFNRPFTVRFSKPFSFTRSFR